MGRLFTVVIKIPVRFSEVAAIEVAVRVLDHELKFISPL